MDNFYFIFALSLCAQSVDSLSSKFTATPDKNGILIVEAGTNVTMTWEYEETGGESVKKIIWGIADAINKEVVSVFVSVSSAGVLNDIVVPSEYINRTNWLGNASFELTNVSLSDKNYFGCDLYFGFVPGDRYLRHQFELDVQDGPYIDSFLPPDGDCEVGKACQFNCTASGDPTPVVTWSYNGHVSTTGNGRAELVLNVNKNDPSMTYSCHANNDVKTVFVKNVTVNPIFPPEVTLVTHETGASNWTGFVNGSVIIECQALGNPLPNITLIKTSDPGNILPNPYNITKATISEHNGEYKCTAENTLGNDTKTIWLNVYDHLAVTIVPSSWKYVENKSVSIYCQASGGPPPITTILYKTSDSKNILTTPYNISRVTRSDHNEEFVCFAYNSEANVSASLQLQVFHKPYNTEIKTNVKDDKVKTGESVKITCTTNAFPAPNFTLYFNVTRSAEQTATFWIIDQFNASKVGEYYVFAENKYGNETSEKLLLTEDTTVTTLTTESSPTTAECCCYKEIAIALGVICVLLILLIILLLIMFCKAKRRLHEDDGIIKSSFDVHDEGHDKHLESNGSRSNNKAIPLKETSQSGFVNHDFKREATDPIDANGTNVPSATNVPAAATVPAVAATPIKTLTGSQIITVKPPCLPPIETVSDKDKA